MGLIEQELNKALYSPVRRKANTARNLRSIAKRLTNKKANPTEVMVKITSFGTVGQSSATSKLTSSKGHNDYITRNGKIEMENDRGEIFSGKSEVAAYFKEWEKDFMDGKRHINQRDTMHLVLSMPDTTDPRDVRLAARAFAKELFASNHEYVMVLHHPGNDKMAKQPHVHLDVKCLGFNGKRLNPRKADLQEWREVYADKLDELGINAVASPRRSRGVVKKAEKAVIRHIEKGDKTHPPRTPKIVALKTAEIVSELKAENNGQDVLLKPWDEAIKKRWHSVRNAYLAAANEVERDNQTVSGEKLAPEDNKIFAANLRAFAASMQPIVTERDAIKAALRQKFSKQKQRQPDSIVESLPQSQNLEKDGAGRPTPSRSNEIER